MQILAEEDRLDRLAEFGKRLVGWVLHVIAGEPAQNRFCFRRAKTKRGRISGSQTSAEGRIFAIDIDEKYAIPKLKELVQKESLENVAVIQSVPADPKLSTASIDAALMVNVYHEVEPFREMLGHVLDALKPGGRFVIVDNMPHKTKSRPRADQTKNHVLSPDLAEPEFRAAGFEIVSRKDDFIDRPDEEDVKWMIICRRPNNN